MRECLPGELYGHQDLRTRDAIARLRSIEVKDWRVGGACGFSFVASNPTPSLTLESGHRRFA